MTLCLVSRALFFLIRTIDFGSSGGGEGDRENCPGIRTNVVQGWGRENCPGIRTNAVQGWGRENCPGIGTNAVQGGA